MWTYIEKSELENLLLQHHNLVQYIDDLILLTFDNKFFFPRYIYKYFPCQSFKQTFGRQKNIKKIKFNTKFEGELKPEQEKIVNHIEKLYKRNNNQINGIIKARPGLGKTVLAIYLACKLNLKTLIIVDSTNLLEQWVKEIFKFTDLTEKDIGIIHQKLFAKNKSITVAMLQTLNSKLKTNFNGIFKKIDNENYDLVIFDEVHKSSSAPKFAKTSILFRTQNIIGLSATPFHQGLHDILMRTTVGDILYETKEYDLKPTYYMIYYNSNIPKKESRKFFAVKDFNHKRAIYNSLLTKSDNYFNLINNYTGRLLAKDYKVIIICFTKKQVEMISDFLTANNIENRRFYGEEREIDKDNDKVIVATYSFAGTGFDFQDLSALILATPLAGKKSLIQVIGRILRSSSTKNQKPVVLDFIDLSFPTFSLPMVKMKTNVVSNEFNCDIQKIEEIT